MGNEPVIDAESISKSYQIFARPADRLKQIFWRGRKRYYKDFYALQNIDFKVYRGEKIGIVGRNGSGKSTLLQILCGIFPPTDGRLKVNGRIAALLELGAGFNGEFTGRENVYLNAAILGLSVEEIDSRYEQIVSFADIGDYINQPAKSYSSGMYMRLAFAVAVCVDPDILVVDEALSVGDEAFQRKCFARIEQIHKRGGTILFVSHSAHLVVQLCDRAILLDGGEMLMDGEPKTVVGNYQRLVNLQGDEAAVMRETIRSLGEEPHSQEPSLETEPVSAPISEDSETEATQDSDQTDFPVPEKTPAPEKLHGSHFFDQGFITQTQVDYVSQGAKIFDLRIEAEDSEKVNHLIHGEVYYLRYSVEFFQDFIFVGFGMAIKTREGVYISGEHNLENNVGIEVNEGDIVDVTFPIVNRLTPNVYFCNAGVIEQNEHKFLHRILDGYMFRVIPGKTGQSSTCLVNLKPEDKELHYQIRPRSR
ncbi:MAG: ABC transporter ATP-binding protein [Hyphomicrobiales bacterium]|nr:MAG: ABC transporter ATP-binding protein [Hyphomicrobiales bacterium]